LICEVFTLDHADNSHSGKTVDWLILSRKPQDSPGTVSTGESPLEKKGPII